METRVQRALQNRWVATAAAIIVGYIGLQVALYVIEGGYYDYYLYPRLKGTEYSYPEPRYNRILTSSDQTTKGVSHDSHT